MSNRQPEGNQSSRLTVDSPRKGYWIRSTIYYCPICAGEDVYRQRVYDEPKPVDWEDRNEVIEKWDYCGAL